MTFKCFVNPLNLGRQWQIYCQLKDSRFWTVEKISFNIQVLLYNHEFKKLFGDVVKPTIEMPSEKVTYLNIKNAYNFDLIKWKVHLGWLVFFCTRFSQICTDPTEVFPESK